MAPGSRAGARLKAPKLKRWDGFRGQRVCAAPGAVRLVPDVVDSYPWGEVPGTVDDTAPVGPAAQDGDLRVRVEHHDRHSGRVAKGLFHAAGFQSFDRRGDDCEEEADEAPLGGFLGLLALTQNRTVRDDHEAKESRHDRQDDQDQERMDVGERVDASGQ